MARGFLGGALLGGVVSIGAAAAVSVISPAPQLADRPPQVSDAGPNAVQAPQIDEGSGPVVATKVEEIAPQQAQNAQPGDAPETDTLAALDDLAVGAIKAPQTAEVVELNAPADVPQTGGLTISQEDPVFPNPQALAPMIPQEADGVAIDTAPAALPTSIAAEAATQATEIAQQQPTQAQTPQPSQTSPGEKTAEAVTAAPAEMPLLVTPAPAEVAVVEEPASPPQQVTLLPIDTPAEVVTEEAEIEANANEVAQAERQSDNGGSETPMEVMILTPSAPRQIGTPAISLTNRTGNVAVNRLGTRIEDAKPEDVTVITDPGARGSTDNRPPVIRFAQAFGNGENKPLMSIVLIDDGSSQTSSRQGMADLRSFPYPLSFAIDSSLPDAAERMAFYRGEGFEVLAMVDLPEGAQPTDVETTLGSILPQMSEVVGVLEGTSVGLQGSRSVSDQVTAILAQSGHGLVTQDKGLNTMPKLARKEGVPADPVFRDFDSKGQTATVIRRFLDQAAFKAGQEGAVIMLGRLRPDTISALLLWGLQDRAGQVALAPISAVLNRDGG